MSTDATAPRPIDMADLVSALVSMREPSRDLDRIVHAMVAGDAPRMSASASAVRLGSWLASEVPPYTEGGRAVSVLAHRLGVTVRTERVRHGWRATVHDPADGSSRSASSHTEGGAACAALAGHAALRTATRAPVPAAPRPW